ncbi:MAG TPA: aminotransferase class I/II-fold pyridoxal phosphate-dependent enzyme, partial [Candidatus Paceibacterota bacterium]|nr:aminotransferase class I/II-fold pyridoxal phosphate-dependent enzyme [Candidatus Paceibacterota bacterium]
MIKPISISLSPNTEPDDVRLAFGLLFQPDKWKKGSAPQELEQKFAARLGVQHACAFNSGRSAFLAILESLGLEKGSEVLLQAFTCNAVPNPVMWAGLQPVYVDCNESDFNIDVEDLERKITSKSRVVVVQHTFGLPADMSKVMEICQKHNLILIEDCAHALGAKYKGKEVGSFGKAAFFSFSRDKVISSVYGGMAVTSDDSLASKIQAFQEKAGYPARYWVWQQLAHPVAMNWKILPTYSVFGKYLLVLSQWLHVLSKAVHWKEKRGMKPGYFPKRMPNAQAILALRQLGKLDRFNAHRKEIAQKYYTALTGSTFELPKQFAERENIFLR